MRRLPLKEFIFFSIGFIACLSIITLYNISPVSYGLSSKNKTISVTETWFPITVNGKDNVFSQDETFIYNDRLYLAINKLAKETSNLQVTFDKGMFEGLFINEDTGLGIFEWQEAYEGQKAYTLVNLSSVLRRYQNENLPYVVSKDFRTISGKKTIEHLDPDTNGNYIIEFGSDRYALEIYESDHEEIAVLVDLEAFEEYKLPFLLMIYENERYIKEHRL